MHDTRLEEHIRSTLAADGDAVPLTITTAELERRLALRRRDRNGRRLTLMAAAVAAVAVGSIIALGNGWLQLRSVGTDPSPAPVTTPAPSRVSQDGASTLGPIGVTPGRQELFRADPDDMAERPMQPFVVPAEGAWVLGTIACLGDGDVRQSVEPDVGVIIHCLPDRVVESEGWFAVIDGQVRGSLAGSGDAQYAFLIESPGPGDTPPVTEASPAPTPTPTPIPTLRVAPTLGGPRDAVLVRSDAGSPTIEVIVAESAERNITIADLPLPAGETVVDARARTGPTGYLAIPRNTDDEEPPGPDAVYIYDLTDYDDEPLRIEGGSGGFGWAPDGRLAILDALTITVIDPADGAVLSVTPVPAGIVIAQDGRRGAVWGALGQGLLASRIQGDRSEPGILALDGSFVADPSPSVFAPTGFERVYDRDGRGLFVGCDSSGSGAPEAACSVSAGEFGVDQTFFYSGNDIVDQRWAADADAAWLLLGTTESAAASSLRVQRGTEDAMEDVATVNLTVGQDGRIGMAFTPDDRRIAFTDAASPDDGTVMTHFLDTDTGDQYGISGAFTGWADQTGATYPAP